MRHLRSFKSLWCEIVDPHAIRHGTLDTTPLTLGSGQDLHSRDGEEEAVKQPVRDELPFTKSICVLFTVFNSAHEQY